MVSLARALSKLGYTSRSRAAVLIREGGVTINGAAILDPDFRCSLEHDRIAVGGNTLRESNCSPVYLMLNKPAGYVTTRADERGRKTVYDLLDGVEEWLFPIGRLDKDSSGLLLFTNDHRLGERLTNPANKVTKTYAVTLDRPIAKADVTTLESGMILDGMRLLPARVLSSPHGSAAQFEIKIVEGKNRQIRRMLAALGYDVRSLERVAIARYRCQGLAPGKWKYLNKRELALLLDGE